MPLILPRVFAGLFVLKVGTFHLAPVAPVRGSDHRCHRPPNRVDLGRIHICRTCRIHPCRYSTNARHYRLGAESQACEAFRVDGGLAHRGLALATQGNDPRGTRRHGRRLLQAIAVVLASLTASQKKTLRLFDVPSATGTA